MQEQDDMELLREYAERGNEEAFATIVARHVNKVYSVALRHAGNPDQAEEITQAVFVILARKARHLRRSVILSGWLYQTARLTSLSLIRGEIRRAHREQEAQMRNLPNEAESAAWTQIAPVLDAAMASLNETDRHAVVLRYFDGKSMREVGAALGANEDAAKKRVGRAVEKLQKFFAHRGIASTTAVVTGAISANSVQAAPVALAKSATALAMAKGATATGSTLSLVQGGLKAVAWTQAKAATLVGATIVLAAGTTTTAFMVHQKHQAQLETNLPKSSWAFAGYADPASTIQTLAWAVGRNDGKTMFGCLSDECQKEFRELVSEYQQGVTAEQFLLQSWGGQLRDVSSIKILRSETNAEDVVLLDLALQGGGKSGDRWIKLKKFGDEWKVDDFDPHGQKGRTGRDLNNAEYGGIGVELAHDPNTHDVSIKTTLTNSPASEAGLSPGMIVRRIDGESMAGKSTAEYVFRLRGRVGTKVKVELFDPTLNQTNTVELTRAKLAP